MNHTSVRYAGRNTSAQVISRRHLLTRCGWLLASAAAAHEVSSSKRKVIVAGGHPGDPEYGCGGAIARFADLGYDITLLYLNRGEKGCPGKSADACGSTRAAEAARACEILGARPKFSDQIDGEAVVDAPHYDSFHRLLEAEAPNLVLTHWPIDNHRDHRAITMLVYDAWLRMNKSFALYYYEVSDGEDTTMFSPTDYVDISRTAARKRAACYAHASQSPERYYALQEQVTRFRGIESGYAQAEAFVRQVGSQEKLP